MPHASRSYDSATLTEALRIIDAALGVMAAREAKGEYYMEETLLKRVTEGASVAGACEVCDDNIAAGWIDSDEPYPSGDDGPEFHPNCFLAGTAISSVGQITHCSIRRYAGKIVVLRGPGMPEIAVTRNHPILTERGWVAAGQLQLSDGIVQCLSPRAIHGTLYPNHDYVESAIEDVPHAFVVAGDVVSTRVPTSSEAFHGDAGINGEVEIVRSASPLSKRVKVRQFVEHNRLARRHLSTGPLPLKGTERQLLHAAHSPTCRSVGRSGSRASLFGGHARGVDYLGFAGSTLLEPDLTPVARDGSSGDSRTERESQHALAGLVRFVQLQEIDMRDFDGQVFNLSSASGLYVAGTIIAHNCVCEEEYKESRKRVYA